jgi:SAM-dependent methyltransferase
MVSGLPVDGSINSVVDLGSGSGRALKRLACALYELGQPVTRAFGIELHEPMLAITKALYRQPGILDGTG